MKRKFYVTQCECGRVDGAILITKSYNCTRDLAEWTKEGRPYTIIETDENNKFPAWCNCHDEEEEQEDD